MQKNPKTGSVCLNRRDAAYVYKPVRLATCYTWECDKPSSWRPVGGASPRWSAGCSAVWKQTPSSDGCWWILKTQKPSGEASTSDINTSAEQRASTRSSIPAKSYVSDEQDEVGKRLCLFIFCTWPCNFRFLDEFVVWKVQSDLLCDFPRAGFHSLRLQHLQQHKLQSVWLKMIEIQKYTNVSFMPENNFLSCQSNISTSQLHTVFVDKCNFMHWIFLCFFFNGEETAEH